ncbi:NAD(P)/FAD-dependent oxidoreductase [Agrilutibacter solisilvae]|uniref:FAD-binding oxidoreductase n=1 Tax=Agrilutibacter solisilvae TaxID=2763317 RepID=A0A974XYA5_9GAMM|nr:FAD-dependent oxidoreductase [Lysobacter solisilvae]QSX77085.1 FAD-binding oxidoreductase [Lysobacter solisilvae]
MDVKSGYPYWAVKNGLMHAFPALDGDTACDVAVIGGGISGALIATELASHGFDVIVLEQRDVAWGSTAASTALLQYEIDTHLTDLAGMVGEAHAVRAYLACADAIDSLAEVAHAVGDVGFARARSLYYASRRWHRGRLEKEFQMRRRCGLDVHWLDRDALQARFAIDAPGAILSAKAARVDPYRLASRLLDRLRRHGGRVFDRSCVARLEPTPRGVTLHTAADVRVRARHVVMAAGYACQQWLDQRVARNSSSYAFVSDPQPRDVLGPFAHTMAWESARPYLYFRSTVDGRLMVGGQDDAVDIPSRRDRRVERKARRLVQRMRDMFPRMAALQPAYSWAGTFAETRDGLPFFGAHAQWGPRVLFAMAYGGNGITYSILGAQVLRAQIERRTHPLGALFGFGRLG